MDFLKILGQLKKLHWISGIIYLSLVMSYENFFIYGLVLEMLENSKNVGNFRGE